MLDITLIHELNIITFYILTIVCCCTNYLLYPIQQTTLWLSTRLLQGGKLPLEKHDKKYFNLIQTLITPKNQSRRQIALPILIIALIISGLFIHWYSPIISLLVIYLIPIVLTNRKLYKYISTVESGLVKKQLEFQVKNDPEKYATVTIIIDLVHEQFVFAKENNLKLNSK